MAIEPIQRQCPLNCCTLVFLLRTASSRHSQGVCAFSEARCRLQIFLLALMLVFFIALMIFS